MGAPGEPREAGNVLATGPDGLAMLTGRSLQSKHFQLPAFQLKPADVKNERLM